MDENNSRAAEVKTSSGPRTDNGLRRLRVRSVWILLCTGLIVAALLTACGPRSSQSGTASGTTPPQGTVALTGEQLLQERCTVCHNLDRIQQASKTSDEWDATVTRMMGKGAQLSEDEKKVLVDYLAKTYGP